MESIAELGELPPTTGEDIGKITWPRVAAEPGKVSSELEGAGPHAYPARTWNTVEFHGVYESCALGLSQEMRISPEENGMALVDIALSLPGNGGHAWEKRSVNLVAHVRESWLSEVARGASGRAEQGQRIVRATLALALVPGQHTVAIMEERLSARDAAAMLRRE